MAKEEHLEILKHGVAAWNQWRDENPEILPDLRLANLARADLSGANLNLVNLSGAILSDAKLIRAKLRGTRLNGSNLYGADLRKVDLYEASLRNSELSIANLTKANLNKTYFNGTKLDGSDMSMAHAAETIFNDVDLSTVRGLDTIKHFGPSTVGIDSLYKSRGQISDVFLRGCGVPDHFIAFIASHFAMQQAIFFYSCFISYSTKDEEFARRLHSRMQGEHLRVWFAPDNIKGGQKLHDQLESAIQSHDKLLLVISDNSMQSEWVITEIRNARRVEIEEKRRKLFPIRLVNFETIKKWKRFDGETGKDLAVEVREYVIPDFSNWKDDASFEAAFNRLMRDLRIEQKS